MKADRATFTVDAQKNGTLRVTYPGWDEPKIMLANESLELVWEGGQVWAYRRTPPPQGEGPYPVGTVGSSSRAARRR